MFLHVFTYGMYEKHFVNSKLIKLIFFFFLHIIPDINSNINSGYLILILVLFFLKFQN